MPHYWGEGIYVEKGGWFIGLRWAAVAGGLVILSAASFLMPLDVQYGKLVLLLLLVGFLNGFYLVYWNQLKRGPFSPREWALKARQFLHVQMGVDLLALTLLLTMSGGAKNPLFFFYLLHLVIGGILFTQKESAPYAFAAIVLPWALYWTESWTSSSYNPWNGLVEIQPPYQKALLLAYTLTAAGLWFFLTQLVADLREKESRLWVTGEKLHQANEELKELDVFKNRFLKQVVTQVKEPLMDIGLELGKVEKALAVSEESTLKATETAKKRIWALLQLIEDLVWLSRARVQDISFKREWVDVYETLRKCIQTKEALAEERGIHFLLHGEPQVRLQADRESLEKVADNLITNAVQYTPVGWGDILVEFKIEGDWLELAVEDHGIGISAKNQKNLFQEFYRGSNAKKEEKFGTGLGLSIVKSVLEMHGGKIQISSEPKKGTRVATWWPNVQEATLQADTRIDSAAGSV